MLVLFTQNNIVENRQALSLFMILLKVLISLFWVEKKTNKRLARLNSASFCLRN